MSKIGKKPIQVPSGVEVKLEDSFILVKGLKGSLKKDIPDFLKVSIDNNQISVMPQNKEQASKDKDLRARWGLVRALISNMIKGVSDGFEKVLEFQGVGYKAVVKGKDLELNLGYSHPIIISGTDDINFSVEKNSIKISGVDNELIGKVAAEIRKKRPPEPYKGHGIRYKNEIIRRKVGKKAVTTG